MELKSILVDISSEVWNNPNLKEAKDLIKNKVMNSKIDENDRNSILQKLETIKFKKQLDQYVVNSILYFEGKSINKYEKTK